MKTVTDRIVQYANRYKLTNVETGEILGTFDFDEVTGTVQQVGTEIDKELFDSIANDLAARVKLSGGELAGTIVTFSDISGTAANVASGDTSATLWGKVKNWFSRLKALAFKNKVAAGDFEAGAIKNADVAADAAIAQSKVSGLMTDYVASISVSGRTVTYKNKSGVNMGSITTQDTTYGLASQSSNGLMSSTDKTKLNGIENGAQKNTVLGVKGGSESAYRTGNINITKANIGLGNVDNTSDEDKPVSTATQTALNGKANTSGTYPNMTAGNATKLNGKAASEYAFADDIPDVSSFAEKNGNYPDMSVGTSSKLGSDNVGNSSIPIYLLKGSPTAIVRVNNTSIGSLGYEKSTYRDKLITLNTIAFWNGAYQNTNSNLRYCSNGEIVGTYGNQTISGMMTFKSPIIGNLQGKADSATTSQTSVNSLNLDNKPASEYALKTGNYSQMTVGNAQKLNGKSANSYYNSENLPYQNTKTVFNVDDFYSNAKVGAYTYCVVSWGGNTYYVSGIITGISGGLVYISGVVSTSTGAYDNGSINIGIIKTADTVSRAVICW